MASFGLAGLAEGPLSRTAAEPLVFKGVNVPVLDAIAGRPNPGDLWVDMTAALLKRCTGINPDVWVSVEGGGGVAFADAETPSGTINSVNTTFTLVSSPNPAASLMLHLNGVLQTAGGVDYTLAGNTITYVTAPATGDKHIAWYRH
jgi:hypothetical protein